MSADRPQDVGRRHVRRGMSSAETLGVLERYRAALRAELASVLDEAEAAGGLPAAERAAMWRHARQVAHELAEGDDPPARMIPAPAAAGRRPPRLSARDRAALEQ